jgi:hypothetical protein
MKKIFLLVSFITTIFLAANAFATREMAGMTGAEPQANPQPITGKVLEVIHSSSYTYLLLENADGFKDWVAIPELYVTVGEDVELIAGQQMGNFKSKPLNRTFEHILFSAGPTEKYNERRKVNAHKGVDMSEPAPGKKKNEAKVIEGLKVEKAAGDNSYSIAEVMLKKDALQDKIITVRGQVVKVSTGIMGHNWVHIKDGSSDKEDSKLVITTKDITEVGAVVTATGAFHNNVDFGGGYKYAVIMEDATIK